MAQDGIILHVATEIQRIEDCSIEDRWQQHATIGMSKLRMPS